MKGVTSADYTYNSQLPQPEESIKLPNQSQYKEPGWQSQYVKSLQDANIKPDPDCSELVKSYLPENSETHVQCKFCDNQFSAQEDLNQHIVKVHNFLCADCNLGFHSEAILQKHIETVHERKMPVGISDIRIESIQSLNPIFKEVPNDVKMTYTCETCKAKLGLTYKFKDEESLRKHFISVHEGKEHFTCTMCNEAKFSRKDALTKHQASVHGGGSYQCKTCNSTIIGEYQFKLHLNSHQQGTDIKCQLCPINTPSFGSKLFLDNHIKKVHSELNENCKNRYNKNVKAHVCPICNKAFTEDRNMKRHIQVVHEGKKLFHCQTCYQRFGSKQELIRHVLIHDAQSKMAKNFKCSIENCPESFLKKQWMLNHIKESHEDKVEKLFKCGLCNGPNFSSKAAISQHFIDFHQAGNKNVVTTSEPNQSLILANNRTVNDEIIVKDEPENMITSESNQSFSSDENTTVHERNNTDELKVKNEIPTVSPNNQSVPKNPSKQKISETYALIRLQSADNVPGQGLHHCPICNCNILGELQFKLHAYSHQQRMKCKNPDLALINPKGTPEQRITLKSDNSVKNLTSKKTLNNNNATTHKISPITFPCPICYEQFVLENDMKKHIQIIHEKNPKNVLPKSYVVNPVMPENNPTVDEGNMKNESTGQSIQQNTVEYQISSINSQKEEKEKNKSEKENKINEKLQWWEKLEQIRKQGIVGSSHPIQKQVEEKKSVVYQKEINFEKNQVDVIKKDEKVVDQSNYSCAKVNGYICDANFPTQKALVEHEIAVHKEKEKIQGIPHHLKALSTEWMKSQLQEAENVSIPKDKVYADYLNHCKSNSITPLSIADFEIVLKKVFPNAKYRNLGTYYGDYYCGLKKQRTLYNVNKNQTSLSNEKKEEVELFKCGLCNIGDFSSQTAINQHFLEFHPDASKYKKPENFNEPKQNEGEMQIFTCGLCRSGDFSSQTAINQHFLENHPDAIEEDLNINSSPGNLKPIEGKLENFNELQTHLSEQKEESEQIFTCGLCNSGDFPSQSAINQHFLQYHPEGGDKKIEKHQNIISSQESSNQIDYNKVHYTCYLCKIDFSRVKNLDEHMAMVHDSKKPNKRSFRCGLCNGSFSSNKAIDQHIMVFHNPKKETLKQISGNQYHTSSLGNPKPIGSDQKQLSIHPCKLCNINFSSEKTLIEHNAMAHGEKNKKFTPLLSDQFWNPQLSLGEDHFKTKAFKCAYCNDIFSSSKDINQHVKEFHKEFHPARPEKQSGNKSQISNPVNPLPVLQFLKCNLCTTKLRFRNEKSLLEHISTVHESKKKNNKSLSSHSDSPKVNGFGISQT